MLSKIELCSSNDFSHCRAFAHRFSTLLSMLFSRLNSFSRLARLSSSNIAWQSLPLFMPFNRLDVADTDVTCTGMLGNSSCFGPGVLCVPLSSMCVEVHCHRGVCSRCGVAHCRWWRVFCCVGLCSVTERIYDAWWRPALGRQLWRQHTRLLCNTAFF